MNPKHLKKTNAKGLLAFSILLFLAVSWVAIDALFDLFYRARTVIVPDFSGQAIEDVQAEEWMELITEYRYDGSTEAGRVISVRDLQSQKAPSPMVSTPHPTWMDERA